MKILNEIQRKLVTPKEQFNKHGGYKYRSVEDILAVIKPLLGDAKLVITDKIHVVPIEGYASIETTDKQGNVTRTNYSNTRVYIEATATLTDKDGNSESCTAYSREPFKQKGMSDSQVTLSASSFARKQALGGLFLLDDSREAPEGDNGKELPPKLTPDELQAIEAICKIVQKSAPKGKVVDRNKVASVIRAVGGDLNKTEGAAVWIINEKLAEVVADKPKDKPAKKKESEPSDPFVFWCDECQCHFSEEQKTDDGLHKKCRTKNWVTAFEFNKRKVTTD